MKTLLLKFSGPLQSWGINSFADTRTTDNFPSKSAVIGLISASFGHKRDETKNIQKFNNLDFGVRIDNQGEILVDFHIARTHDKKVTTYLTHRHYLTDATFLVAISSKDDSFIDEIRCALERPYFQQFLGRRSAPVTYDFIVGETNKDVIDALKEHEWIASDNHKKTFKQKNVNLEIYADAHLLESRSMIQKKDFVISFSQKSRMFNYRNIAKAMVTVKNDLFINSISNYEEHDALLALEEK